MINAPLFKNKYYETPNTLPLLLVMELLNPVDCFDSPSSEHLESFQTLFITFFLTPQAFAVKKIQNII